MKKLFALMTALVLLMLPPAAYAVTMDEVNALLTDPARSRSATVSLEITEAPDSIAEEMQIVQKLMDVISVTVAYRHGDAMQQTMALNIAGQSVGVTTAQKDGDAYLQFDTVSPHVLQASMADMPALLAVILQQLALTGGAGMNEADAREAADVLMPVLYPVKVEQPADAAPAFAGVDVYALLGEIAQHVQATRSETVNDPAMPGVTRRIAVRFDGAGVAAVADKLLAVAEADPAVMAYLNRVAEASGGETDGAGLLTMLKDAAQQAAAQIEYLDVDLYMGGFFELRMAGVTARFTADAETVNFRMTVGPDAAEENTSAWQANVTLWPDEGDRDVQGTLRIRMEGDALAAELSMTEKTGGVRADVLKLSLQTDETAGESAVQTVNFALDVYGESGLAAQLGVTVTAEGKLAGGEAQLDMTMDCSVYMADTDERMAFTVRTEAATGTAAADITGAKTLRVDEAFYTEENLAAMREQIALKLVTIIQNMPIDLLMALML